MKLKDEFETETGQGIYNTEGKESEENNGGYNDAYVEWLEVRVKPITDDPFRPLLNLYVLALSFAERAPM